MVSGGKILAKEKSFCEGRWIRHSLFLTFQSTPLHPFQNFKFKTILSDEYQFPSIKISMLDPEFFRLSPTILLFFYIFKV